MPRPTVRRILAMIVPAALVGGLLFWGGLAFWDRAELGRAESEISAAQGRTGAERDALFRSARDRLARLSARRPGRAEVEYGLGVCEASLGRVNPAIEAWGRVPPDSQLGPRAALDRAKLAIQHGRLASAEADLARFDDARGADGEEAAGLADQVDLFSGRPRRIARRIERRWRRSRDPIRAVRMHWLSDTQPYPVDAIREGLDRFGREAPDDDRVWLGRADLATRTSRLDEADAWLSRCEARRPADLSVARARLAWALDAGRPDAALAALDRLPADEATEAELAALTARLADLRGDAPAERAALQRRVALSPGDAESWRRLGDLAPGETPDGAGIRDRARLRKAEIDRASDEYQGLMGSVLRGDPARFPDLARAAEALGRRFEAEAWWTLRLRQAPDDPDARAGLARVAEPPPAPSPPSVRTLADRVEAASPTALESKPKGGGPSAVATVPTFRDDAPSAGLRFVYDHAPTAARRLPETMGGGVGLIDFDGDGWLDVYAVQGGAFPPPPVGTHPNGDRLFRNRRDGTFEDATDRAGIAGFPGGFGHGVAVGDFDGDGHPDLFVTRWRSYALYRNKGDGTFEDATDRAGLGGPRGWPTSAAFADLDDDGDLDLYVCQYLAWDPERSPPCPDPDRPGKNLYCGPRGFEAEPDRLYRNDGGRFVDVSKEAGIVDRDGRGLGVVVADLDEDGKVDVYVANDMTANFVFRNLGGLRFEEVGTATGAGSNGSGGYQAGMGIACGDLDGDGRPDLAVTNFFGESTSLYRNLGGGMFADRTAASGLAGPTRHVLGFGASFLDADNDGRLDLAIANGHVNDFRPSIPYAMPAQLLLGTRGGRLVDVSDRAGPPWSEPRVGRGLAVGDLDNDGRADLLILSQGGPLAYLHNLGPSGESLTIRLEGTRSNRDAVGAVVRMSSGVKTQVAARLGGGSFLSASDGRLHFGLGPRPATGPPTTASVEVRWPGGRFDRFEGLSAGSYHLIEGDPMPHPLR